MRFFYTPRPESRTHQTYLSVALIAGILLFVAGCATSPSGDPGDGSGEQLSDLFADPVPTPETLVHRGVSISLPEGYRFENAYAAVRSVDAGEIPYGVLARFRSEDADVNGSLQFVYFSEDYTPEAFLETYRESHLGDADASVGTVEVDGRTFYGLVTRGPADDKSDAGGNETVASLPGYQRVVALFPLSERVVQEHAILIEVVIPDDDERRTEAGAIIGSVELPESRAGMRSHARFSSERPLPGFEDQTGHWRWVTDVPGGIIVKTRTASGDVDGDLYLLVSDAPSAMDDAFVDTGQRVEVVREGWRWSLPIGASSGDPRDRVVIIPPVPDPNPDAERRVVVLIASTPARVWRDSDPARVEPLSDQRVAELLTDFAGRALTSW